MMTKKITLPSRPLCAPQKKTLRYVPASNTDIRKTFEKFARFFRAQEKANELQR